MKRVGFTRGILTQILIAAFLLTACGAHSPQKAVADALGIDASNAVVRTELDTHGGFHGDGMTFFVLAFSDNAAWRQIQSNAQWKPFPMDDTVETLLYGTGGAGPFVCDEDGVALVPEISNGAYCFLDRHVQAGGGTDVLDRASFNFTLGIYDSDTNLLYFCALDT